MGTIARNFDCGAIFIGRVVYTAAKISSTELDFPVYDWERVHRILLIGIV